MSSTRKTKFLCMGTAILLNAVISVHPPDMGAAVLWHVGIRAVFTIWLYTLLGMLFFRDEIEKGKLF
ncbi:hypothetical protein ACFVS2_20495 [Brevibacillus sp. NPDC058079]|uniref:hypothetical protein n=1 Tax=Brevibacillus sp. NPDC058079 TaxID=3346330 RepID=UPI0036EDB46A